MFVKLNSFLQLKVSNRRILLFRTVTREIRVNELRNKFDKLLVYVRNNYESRILCAHVDGCATSVVLSVELLALCVFVWTTLGEGSKNTVERSCIV